MAIIWNGSANCYWFDTGKIFGGIDPYNDYHGICGLMHADEKINIVNVRNSFLNAEYYLRPNSGLVMRPRKISREKQTTHKLEGDTVNIHFPTEPEFEFEMDLAYTSNDDAVDLLMTIMPTKDIKTFEIFFASYVCQGLDETWVPLKNDDGTEEWKKLDNRKVKNECFGIVRDEKMLDVIKDGRYNDYKGRPQKNKTVIEDRFFSKPILIARNSSTGFAIVFMLDHDKATYLMGQFHGWDTAHDWCFGDDLTKGQPFIARARMLYRPFESIKGMFAQIDDMWSDFILEKQ